MLRPPSLHSQPAGSFPSGEVERLQCDVDAATGRHRPRQATTVGQPVVCAFSIAREVQVAGACRGVNSAGLAARYTMS
jgi:hypothetical protein